MDDENAAPNADDRTRSKRPRWKTVLFAAATICGVLLLGAGATEIGLRIFLYEEEANGGYWAAGAFEADPAAGFCHAAGFHGRAYRKQAFDCPVEIQANHLRQKNYAEQMKYERRVLILGDSFTFGLGVNEEDAFPSLLQPMLNSRGIGVINGGQTAFCTDQEVAFGKRLAGEVKPDAILLCVFPENDVIGNYYKNHRSNDVINGYRLPGDRVLPLAPIDFLRTHSYLWMFVEHHYRSRTRESRLADYNRLAVENPAALMQPTFDNLLELRDFCRAEKIRLGVVLIPSVRKDPFMQPLKHVLRQLRVPMLDLTRAGFGAQHRFAADDHWNERGHAEVTRHLAPFCLEVLESAADETR